MRFSGGTILDPSRFKAAINERHPMFRGFDQHDAQEFLRSLLEGLHEDLKRVQERPSSTSEAKDLGKLSEAEKAQVAWNKYHAVNGNAIADLFVGQLCSILECEACGHSSYNYEEFWDLSLPIPEIQGKKTIEHCVNEFAKKERLEGYKCSGCSATTSTTKRLKILKEPQILVIHVKRFATDGAGFCSKIKDAIACQLHNFSLESAGGPGAKYDLFAACTHRGGFGGGHYIAHVKNPDSSEWYEMDDHTVSRPMARPPVANAYMLFYAKTQVVLTGQRRLQIPAQPPPLMMDARARLQEEPEEEVHHHHNHYQQQPGTGPQKRSSLLMRKGQEPPFLAKTLPAGSPSRTSSLRGGGLAQNAGRGRGHDFARSHHDDINAHHHHPPLPPPSPHRPVQHYASTAPPLQPSRLSMQFSDITGSAEQQQLARYSPSLSVQSEQSSLGLHSDGGPKRATVVHAGARLSALGSPSPALSDRTSVYSAAGGGVGGRAPTPRLSAHIPDLSAAAADAGASAAVASPSPLPPSSLPPPRRKNSELVAVPVPTVDLYQISSEANAWRAQPSPENALIAPPRSDVTRESRASSLADQRQYWEEDGQSRGTSRPSEESVDQRRYGDEMTAAAAEDYDDSFDAMQYHLYEGTGTPMELPAGGGPRGGLNQPSPPISRASSPRANGGTPVQSASAAAEPTYRMKPPVEFPHNPTPPRDYEDRRPVKEPPRSVASFASKGPRPYLQTTIFSGHLLKQSRHSSFQKRLFRCDGILFVCLSPREVPLPRNADLAKIRTETFYDEKDDFLDYVRRYYPSLPVFPNTLIAEGDADGVPQEDGRNYYAPKWIIPASSILSVRSLIQHPAPMPTAKKARTFIIRTRGRDYTLCAPTPEEFRRWTFLLSRLCLENENRRESSASFDEEDYPRVGSESSSEDGEDLFDRPARFLEKAEAWKRCVRELMAKDPTTHRVLTNVGGSIVIPDDVRDSMTPPASRRGSVYESMASSPTAPPRRSSAFVDPRNYSSDHLQGQTGAPLDTRRQIGVNPASHQFVRQAAVASNVGPNSRTAAPMSPRLGFEDSSTDLTRNEGYDPSSRTWHRRSDSSHVEAGPTLTEIERELSVLRRVPVAEFVSGAAYPPVPVVPAPPSSVSSRNSASLAKTAVVEDTLATDLSSILRIIAHLRGEFLRAPEDGGDSDMSAKNMETPRYAEPRLMKHFITHSIPTLLARIGAALPRHPTCRDVTDDWLELADEWDPERIGLRGQDVIVKDLEQLTSNVSLLSEVEALPTAASYVALAKTRPVPVTADNVKDTVQVTPIAKSPADALYQSIHTTFAPVLLSDSRWGINSKLQNLISDLDSGLASTMRGGIESPAKAADELNVTGITTLDDEFLWWVDRASEKTKGAARAQYFKDMLQPLKIDYDKISSLKMADLTETVEQTQDTLDDLWRQSEFSEYPEERMSHLLEVITEQLISCVQEKFSGQNIMIAPLSKIKDDLKEGLAVLQLWESAAATLTGRLWPHYAAHQWTGPTFAHDQLPLFTARLLEVQNLRGTHELLLHLLTPDEQRELHVSETLTVFEKVNPLHINKYNEANWKSAVLRYLKALEPVEHRAIARLRTLFGGLQGSSSQLLREFQRYSDLLKRESIALQLGSERDALLGQLVGNLRATDKEFQERQVDSKDRKSKNVPTAVNNIIWARQTLTKSEESDRFVVNCFGKNAAYSEASSKLYEKLKQYEKTQFADWIGDMETAMDSPEGPMALKQAGRLMELDYTDGKLKVNFSNELVTLIREVRQLLSLGFAVPLRFQQIAETAQRYYRHGVVLKQVAHFYNTIDHQMLPSQHAMLLEPALAFERLVKGPQGTSGDELSRSSIKWDSPRELEEYIAQVQQAAERLTSANRKLRQAHSTICNHVVSLMSVDLVKNQTRWKETLNTIRGIIGLIEDGGIKPEDTLAWRNHWDYQIYKALEHQYQVGLESLNESLPEIKVDLVFKQQKLQLRPPFEEVRAKYYRDMKKFLNIPAAFRGLGETDIFPAMTDNNAGSLSTVYTKANQLFDNLSKVQDVFKDWVVLGTVDLEEIVEESLVDISDFEANFRMLKTKGKEAEQLPSEFKVDCITVSTTPVKATIDDHLQRLFDAMLGILRKAVSRHMATVDEFVAKGSDMLSKRPQSMAEIGEANARHDELAGAQASIRANFEAAEAKNKLLKSVAGGGIDVSAVQARWTKLEIMLESHDLMIKEQVDVLRTQIEGRRQAFGLEVDKFAARWHQLKPKAADAAKPGVPAQAVQFVKDRRAEFSDLKRAADQIIEDCAHFGVAAPDFPEVDALDVDIAGSEQMWGMYDQYMAEIENHKKEDWITFRNKVGLFEDTLSRWSENLRGKPVDAIAVQIQRDIDSYRDALPVLKFMHGDNWTPEHWADLYRITGIQKGISLADLTFAHILAAKEAVVEHMNEVKELNSRAQGEISIREAIQELDMWGAGATFALTDYQDVKGNNVQLIKDWKDLLTQVGDNQSLLQSLKDSPYFKNFADKAIIWERKLVALEECLRNLNTVQRKWVYLEPIFNRGALPNEQHRFARIDDDFRGIMSGVSRDARVVALVSQSNVKDVLITLVDQLERCQKALNEFLEQKRAKFARFYFIGDEDLLEILGQAKNPTVIQAHLKKLFAGVHSVQFDENVKNIISMKSIDGETVPLSSPVKITDDVEVWLEDFAKEMKSTLKTILAQCLLVTDLFKFPSQILTLAEYLHFTANVETAISQGGNFGHLARDLRKHLDEYTTFDSSTIEDPVERNVVELKIKSLILDIIHLMDVVTQLQAAGVINVADWTWQRQLRFYMDDDKVCTIRMSDAEFAYTYEYQGIPPKLVHTPLTDKCYLTLTQAMSSGFGGNPFGPAGTGKTESVKALGVLFGRQVLVFNCDEGIDYKSMGRIFVGLVKCGAWGCFDEFNRLEEAVLSAVSQQIQIIQAALKAKAKQVELLGKTVDLDANSGIFVTLNPAGKGYGGRQKLPDNLKQLFRSIAMTHPDNELISEVILFSEGFHGGKELGSKVVSVFTLCKQLLSQQQHYDWGLRPLKAVLGLAGRLLHEEKKKGPVSTSREPAILVKALRVNTLSKLTFADSLRFDGLMKDIFPEVPLEEVDYEDLAKAVKEAYAELNLIYIESQAQKVYQFYQACRQRMGVVVVGPSGSGKSTLWRVLRCAWQKVGQKLRHHMVNPKAIDRNALLGHMDMDTREWFDGVLTAASRQAVKEPGDVHTWILSDGDIDPEWVESLNSVLDDNRLLTMPNGERIQFGPNVNFIFETHNLRFASPATVSRMGMIYLSDETLDISALVQGWLAKQSEALRGDLTAWTEMFFEKSIDWVTRNAEMVVDTTKVGLVMNGLSHLNNVTSRAEYLYSLIRGLGANLYNDKRLMFANELLQWAGERNADPKRTLDYYVDQNGDLQQYALRETNDLSAGDFESEDHVPVIETTDLQKTVDILTPWIDGGHPFMLVGPEGAGKHMVLQHCFSKLKSTSIATIHCSAQTRSSHVLQRLKQTCTGAQTAAGRVMRPRDAEKLILYLKDINLPKPDKYETVELVQFLQQLLTYQGFYDQSLEWVGIENVQIIASMNPSTTMGRHELSTRFTSVIRQSYMAYPDMEQLQSVYRTLLQPILTTAVPGHKTWSLPRNFQKLAASMVTIYDEISKRYTPDVKAHYLFTPRDITRWILSLARYEYVDSEQGELLDVVVYEAQRLFQDRLVGTEAKQKLESIISTVLRNEWNHQVTQDDAVYTTGTRGSTLNLLAAKGLVKISLADYKTTVESSLKVFERDYRTLNISLVPEALAQLARVERVLGQAGGSLLLAGRPGVGHLQTVLIVSHMLGLRLFSLNISRSYGAKAFAADLKQILQAAGVAGENSVLVVEDHQLPDAAFLESINSILSGGEVPGLYSTEELDTLLGSLKDKHSEEGFRGTLFEYFVVRVRKYLHVVLLLDSASPGFISRCEANPALYTRCQIGWMDSWTSESMSHIAKASFAGSPALSHLKDQDQLIKHLIRVHAAQIGQGATPKHFSDYLSTYEQVFCSKRQLFESKLKYLGGGLTKMTEASKYVDKLSAEAKSQGQELADKQREADAALKQITDSMVNASEQKKEMEELTVQLKDEEDKLLKRKQVIEAELADVEPIVRASKAAVGEIRSDSLSEIRSLRAPPPAIRDVLEGVLKIMGILDISWNSMKSFLGKRTVKEEIMNFDARNINKQVRDSVSELLRQKKDSFEEATIKRVSVAAAPLATWVKANLQYSTILEKIQPLETDLARLTKSLDASRERVLKLKTELAAVDDKVAALKEDFGGRTREAETLRANLEKAKATISSAQGLLGKLSGEGKRWATQAQEIKQSLESLPYNSLLASAFVTYLAAAPEDGRTTATREWQAITGVKEFEFRDVMSTESEQLVWKSQGLPADALSNENAIIILNCIRTPLIIDPSGQAVSWLKTHLAERKPEVIKQHDENFVRAVELAVRFGKTLIIQEVTSIEPFLYPIVRKELQRQGPRSVLQLGEKTVDYNEDFRLYLVTSRSSFTIPSDAQGYVQGVNFTVTRAGLAGQLLGVTLKHEQPELELEKVKLLKREDELKIQLSQLEESLLGELANSSGNILENNTLIASLNETRDKSSTIATGLQESKRLQASLDAQRDKFAPLSTFGSALFFVISDLSKLNNMYQFSLSCFMRLYEQALKSEGSASNDGTELRIQLLMSTLEKLAFNYISRSLFKADRQMFALHLIHLLHPDLFGENEWDLFTGAAVATEDDNGQELPKWVPAERIPMTRQLMSTLPGMTQSLNFGDSETWSQWLKHPSCETAPPRSHLSAFQVVLLTQTLRPDRLLSAMNNFSCAALGMSSLAPPPLNLEKLFTSESLPKESILFLTTAGADPSAELNEFAVRTVGAGHYHQIAMGQGQGETAISLIRQSAPKGDWVCLQNVHLVTSWMPTLEKELSSVQTHENFRLWMTSEAHLKFPASLLQNSLKITVEAPPGVKKNLLRTYEAWSPSFIAAGPIHRAQALFALAWFHAVIQERRTYIPQGWNKFYEYSAADLRSSADVVSDMCKNSAKSPQWAILHGLLENAIYGGRIDDVHDALKLKTYLAQFFNDDVFAVGGRSPSRKLARGLVLPISADHSAYQAVISGLPETDNVTSFGLPANIDRTLQRNSSQIVVSQLRILRQVDVQGQRFDKEQWNRDLTPFLLLWRKLTASNDLMQRKITQDPEADPIMSFLALEMINALNLLRRIQLDLGTISKVIRGTILLTNDVVAIAHDMLRGETPKSWLALWEGPETPQHFLREAMSNTVAVDGWLEKATAGVLFKDPVKMAGLFNPVPFLNALRQQSSRMLKVPMDGLRLATTWGSTQVPGQSISVTIDGLLLQGCTFDGKRLSEAHAEDPTFAVAPLCNIAWIPKEGNRGGKNVLDVPMYTGPSREKVICKVEIPVDGDLDIWILAGVAIFLKPE
ncbi:Cytoplasmic dynein 2 heavy chain 1 [Geranomyces michiganensis]|nr:Cytoplasmic dynein 2 heavy chain 1 [Geranomyces michiganensis]